MDGWARGERRGGECGRRAVWWAAAMRARAHAPTPPRRTLVRVQLERELAVRLLDLVLRRVGADAQEVVVSRRVALLRPAAHPAHIGHAAREAAKGEAAEHFGDALAS